MSELGRRPSGNGGDRGKPRGDGRGNPRGGREGRDGANQGNRGGGNNRRASGGSGGRASGSGGRGGAGESEDRSGSSSRPDAYRQGSHGKAPHGKGKPREDRPRERDGRPQRRRDAGPVQRARGKPDDARRPAHGGAGRDRPGRDGTGGDRARHSTEPELPEGAEFTALDTQARQELRGLPKHVADKVGQHLVAAGMLVDEDPQRALVHARYARDNAARVPLVREAVGLSAYHAGEWAEAIGELRAVRRMSGSNAHVAVLADCERALGRPERAIELARETDMTALSKESAIELRIVSSGARRDMGELDAAIVSLQGSDLDPKVRQPWSARLFYAYADNLLAAGRTDEAAQWFLHAADADDDGVTDAAERAVELGDAGLA